MPFEDDRLRMQRQEDGTFSAQLPGKWVGHGYSTASKAMNDVDTEITRGDNGEQIRKFAELNRELKELNQRRAAVKTEMFGLKEEINKRKSDSNDLIDAGWDMIELFDIDTRYTRRLGKPINVYVTPWDKNRDGVIGLGEFEICYGWSRYKMPEATE